MGFLVFLPFTLAMLLKVFMPCYFGNELTAASSNLATSLYNSAWLTCDREFKMNMKIFMEHAKTEINFTAFGLFKANLETFTAIVSSAYSLHAFLKTLHNKD